jgi:hypothetical protein
VLRAAGPDLGHGRHASREHGTFDTTATIITSGAATTSTTSTTLPTFTITSTTLPTFTLTSTTLRTTTTIARIGTFSLTSLR